MKKLCLVFNSPSHYREYIYRAIDSEYDCDWYFGALRTGIREMDVTKLSRVKRFKSIGMGDVVFWNVGMINLLFKKKYHNYLMIAETRCINSWIFWLIAFCFFPNKKYYIWTHGLYGKESRLITKMKVWLYRHVSGIFVYGNYARGLIIKKGVPDEKVYVIHNSLNYDMHRTLRDRLQLSSIYREHFGNQNHVILFIGRLTKVKQLNLLLESMAELKKQKEFYNLVIIGDGIEKENLDTMATQLDIKNQVWFYGSCYDERINAELIYNADLCVSPGNVGLTAIHAMSFGTPVISHNDFKWQMPEFEAIHPRQTGDFFERQNANSLKETIHNWFDLKFYNREEVRRLCYAEIDSQWTLNFQMEVLKNMILV